MNLELITDKIFYHNMLLDRFLQIVLSVREIGVAEKTEQTF